MNFKENNVLTIAGLDPTGEAGLIADIKTFNKFSVPSAGVSTMITYQNCISFNGFKKLSEQVILKQLISIFNEKEYSFIKFGMIYELKELLNIINYVLKIFKKNNLNSSPFILWDTIIETSTGKKVLDVSNKRTLNRILKKIDIITPNVKEINLLVEGNISTEEKAKELSNHCYVLLKGLMTKSGKALDILYYKGKLVKKYSTTRVPGLDIHGSGCKFTSAIIANLALGKPLVQAISAAKKYINEVYLNKVNLLSIQQ